MTIRVKAWQLPRTARGSYFYPVTKYVGQVLDADGRVIAETGKCATRAAAYRAAERKRDATP